MAVENLVIKFDVDTKELDFGIKALETLGKIDKQTADQFRAANAAFQAQQKAISEVSKETKTATNDVKALSEASKAATVSTNANTEGTKKSISAFQALRKEIKDLKSGVIEATAAGDKTLADKLSKQAAEATHTMAELNRSVKNLASPERTFNAIVGGAKGIAAGFEVATAASALFGEKDKDLERTIVKLQGSMALLNGLTEIQALLQKDSAVATELSAIKRTLLTGVTSGMTVAETVAAVATNVLNASIKALLGPIGLVISGVALLVGGYELYTAGAKKASEEAERGARIDRIGLEALDAKQKDILDNLKKDIELKKAQGANAKDIYNAEQNLLKTTIAFLIQKQNATSDTKAFQDAQKQIELLKKDELILEAEFNGKITEEKKKAADKQAEIDKKAAEKRLADKKKDAENIAKIEDDLIESATIGHQKGLETDSKLDQEALDQQDEFQAKFIAKLNEGTKETLDAQKERQKQLKDLALSAGKDVSDAAFQIDKANRDAKLEEEITAIETNKQLQFDSIDAQTKKLLENKSLTEKQRQDIEDNAAKKKKVIDDKVRKEEAAIKKKAFEDNKRAAILQAIINTALSVTAALTQVPFSLFAGIAAGIAGAAQVAVIASQPIPKFAKGTQSSPEGLAVVGEMGSELIVSPDGKASLSPDRSSLTYLKKGSKVFTALETGNILNDMSQIGNMYVDHKGNVKEKLEIDEYAMARAMSRSVSGSSINIANHEALAASIASKMNTNKNFF